MNSSSSSTHDRRTLHGIHFIRVRGNTVERARAHANLLKNEILAGPMPVLAAKNEWLIRRGPGLLQSALIQKLVVAFYKKFIVRVMEKNITAEIREATRAVAQEVGLTYEEVRECLLQADAMMLLIRSSMMKHFLPEWIPGSLPGCTSAVASPQWTKSGKLLACRNLDYLVVGPWEKQATVIFNEPSGMGEIPYVALTSAGIPSGGLTSMNQEGITLFTHAHFGRSVSLFGTPIVVIGDEIIRKSKTLGQVIDQARRLRSYANWAFVVSSAVEKESAVIEITPNRVCVHQASDGLLVHSNYFHSKELQEKEALLSGAYCDDLKARVCRVRQLLEPHQGELEPRHMSVVLGDHIDFFTGRERVFGNTLSVMTTIKSAVFVPDDLKFWMSSRKESPVGLGNFVEVDVPNFWKKSAEEIEQSMSTLPSYQPKSGQLLEGVRHYRDAYRAYHIENSDPQYQEKALFHLINAAQAFPQDGHVWIQAGIVAFKLQKFQEAQTYFERTLSSVLSPHVVLVRDLYFARCLDQLGRRAEAVRIYQKNFGLAHEPKLKKAFKKGIKKAYQRKNSSKMIVDLQFPDTFVY